MHKFAPSKTETLSTNATADPSTTKQHTTPKISSAAAAAHAIARRPLNLSQYDGPSFVMAPPLSFEAKVAHNARMDDLSEDQRIVRPQKAMRQFQVLYNFIASRSLVSLVTMPSDSGLQDVVFTGSMGIVLNHLPDNNTVVLSNFSSETRIGEMDISMRYFKGMGYRTYIPRARFEGEADLKHLHDNVYIGGYGLRTERGAYEEMENQFDMRVIKVRETDPYLHHLDRSVFPLTAEKTAVCTEVFNKEELREIEAHTEIVPVSRATALRGLCNSVRMGSHVLNASNINELRVGSEEYQLEIDKNRKLEDICAVEGLGVAFFNLSEFLKSGGALSGMVMHLNRHSYGFRLL